jgi:hypothetical protein
MPLQWKVYFGGGKQPFGSTYGGEWEIRSQPDEKRMIEPGKAIDPGNYKYGIRVNNAETGEELDDNDPWLIVRA